MKRTALIAIFVFALAIFSLRAKKTFAATDWVGTMDRVENRIVDDALEDVGRFDDLRVQKGDFTLNVPILAYHQVRPITSADSRVARRFITSPEEFARQMAYLKANGYTVLSLEELVRDLRSSVPLGDKNIVLTFDDGFANQFKNALPVLVANKYPATFFLITGFVDRVADAMTWADARVLLQDGMTIGGHTRTHPSLPSLHSQEAVVTEVAGAKSDIDRALGTDVDLFAYPYGKYDSTTVAAVKAAGYLAAVGVDEGRVQTSSGRYMLKRFNVDDDHDAFLAAVGGK